MRCLIAFLIALTASAQDPLLLEKIKARVAENLSHLPNYTCTETVERSLRPPRKSNFRGQDTIRFNVAYVEGKEFFGRPGEGRIDQPDVGKVVRGSVGNGQFAMFGKSIFVEGRAIFLLIGQAKLAGKQTFRFDYHVPLENSGYSIQSSAGQALVGYSGSFWATRDTLDLLRLVVSGDNLPPKLWLVLDTTTIDYDRVSIAGTPFLLPVRSMHAAKDLFGAEISGITRFDACHEFVGESKLKFGDP